jgi:hypothetical protein
MELFSYILSKFVHCWCIERLLNFCQLIFYPATLLMLFMMSRSFNKMEKLGDSKMVARGKKQKVSLL